MKLGKVEYSFDGRKAMFFFTAEGRIDFRELVRDLAHRFHIRVEMRQVGVRDEAGLLGGVGVCGRELCCSTWLKDLKPVSIKAAKQQGLMLNPSKLSGLCGRLRCCLNYELPGYGGGGCGNCHCGKATK
jgi:cell fate regulator YaaT (PSP1 superfamily)